MENLKEKHKTLEAEMLERNWELVYDPTPMPLNKLGRLKFLYLDPAGITNMTGVELALILERQHFIKIVKYVRKENGRFQQPQLRYAHLNFFKVQDLPSILGKERP